MTVTLMIKKRLREFELEERDRAKAVQVTEAYISQLLNGWHWSAPGCDRGGAQ